MHRTARKNSAFTLVELLVVIAIIGTLMGLLVPAVQIARESARRTQCMSQIGQIGKALLNFESRMSSLPPGLPNCRTTEFHRVEGLSGGADCQGPNWLIQVLPDLEERRQFDQVMRCLDRPNVKNACAECPQHTAPFFVGTETPSIFVCPSSGSSGSNFQFQRYGLPADANLKLSKGSYVGCFGDNSYISSHLDSFSAGVFEVERVDPKPSAANRRWMVASNRGTRMSEILDGLSKTMMLSEILAVGSETDGRGVWTWAGMGGSSFTARQTPNAAGNDVLPICDPTPGLYQGLNDPKICTESRSNTGTAPEVFATARSEHVGGVQVVLADGSGHFISDSIEPLVWMALATRAGNPDEKNPGVPR